MSIMDLKKKAPKGEFLAYINKDEANLLKKLGGSGKLVNGIPSFIGADVATDPDSSGRTGPGKGGYQGGPKGGYGDAESKDKPSPSVREKEKTKYEKQFGGFSPTGSRPMGLFDRINKYNTDYQKKQNLKLAQKRAFQKYQDIEKYANLMDDYGLTAEEIAAELAANPSYGYDFSSLDLGKKTLGSNIGTNLEKYRTNLYDVQPKTKYSVTQAILDKLRPDTQVTALNTLNKARDYNTLAMDPNISRDKLEALANRGKTPDQINPPRDREGPQPYIPIDYNTGAASIEDIEPYTNDFVYRFGTGQNVGDDVTQGFYNQGGRVPRAFGGIMDSNTGRKAYGLGSVFKSVGKAVSGVAKAAGKVLSSDVGKMAIAGLGAYYLGGGMNLGGARMFGNTGFGKAGFMSNLGRVGTFIKENPFKTIGIASTVLPFLAGGAKPNEDIGMADRGGRLIDPLTGEEGTPASMRANIENAKIEADGDPVKLAALNQKYNNMLFSNLPYENYGTYAQGGRIKAQEGGLMNLGGMEKDYRNEGGFVPIGKAEKADDVPARLSVNEFVFTADAVRNAGGGDIDKGAEVMENMMKNLENGGRISEESQGNTGAQQMFSVSERIGEVI